jgi:hypothetical protein
MEKDGLSSLLPMVTMVTMKSHKVSEASFGTSL